MDALNAIPFAMSDLGSILLAISERARIGFVITEIVTNEVKGVYISDSAVEIFGHSREALMPKDLLDLCVEEERPRVAEIVRRIARRDAVEPYLETVIAGADGRRIDLHCTLFDVVYEGRTFTVNIVTDISDRRDAERVIATSHERFRTLIEAVPDAILVIDRHNVVVYANRGAARLLGYEHPTELVGEPAPKDATGHHRLGSWAEAMEYRFRRRDGSQILVECTSLFLEFEGLPSLVVFARDITERRRMQEQLARADRLAALGTLSAGVAHEINNPLAFMTLNVEALERIVAKGIPDEQMRKKALDVIAEVRSGADRVAAIVRDLRMFSRADDFEDSAVDVSRVVAAAQRLVMHELRLRARVIVELPDLPSVKASPSRLEQVFVNLLLNAAQAFEVPGDRNEVRVTGGVLDDGAVYVDVADNGPGIPREVLGRIFDPFFTTKPIGVGTGLGLSICHGIVSRLGGELTVDSEVGRGTTFRVTLSAQHASAPKLAVADPSEPELRRGRILVVDDEPAIGQSLRSLLEDDHDVDVVTSGECAIVRVLESNPPYDVVFCDMTMREIGGDRVHARVAESRPGCEDRIVFMTGGATTETARAFLGRVPNIRIEKPFSVVALERAIRAVMGS